MHACVRTCVRVYIHTRLCFSKVVLNYFPASHNLYCLLSHLLMFLGSLYCKQYEPRSDGSQGSSLIRVHIVCSH